MVDKKISDLTELTTPVTGDLIEIVDVSDTTDAVTGTNKKITYANLQSNLSITNSQVSDFVSGVQANSIDNIVEDTTPQLGADLDCQNKDLQNIALAEFNSEYDNGNSGTSKTIDWNNGNNQKVTLTDNVTFSFTAPSGPSRLQLKILTGAGSFAVTLPTVKTPGGTAYVATVTASAEDILSLWYDGTSYYLVASKDFS